MARSLRELFRKGPERNVATEVAVDRPEGGRHRADTTEAPISPAEPVAIGAHMKAPEPTDG